MSTKPVGADPGLIIIYFLVSGTHAGVLSWRGQVSASILREKKTMSDGWGMGWGMGGGGGIGLVLVVLVVVGIAVLAFRGRTS